jgi:hypothetical protein
MRFDGFGALVRPGPAFQGPATLAAATIGTGAITYASVRASDSKRSHVDRVASAVGGAAIIIGMNVAARGVGQSLARIEANAGKWVSAGHDYSSFAWPRGTQRLTSEGGGATWYVTPHEVAESALKMGGVYGGISGGVLGTLAVSAYRESQSSAPAAT